MPVTGHRDFVFDKSQTLGYGFWVMRSNTHRHHHHHAHSAAAGVFSK